MTHVAGKGTKGIAGLTGLTLGALGVVYGDIGTSPLYAMKEIFFGHGATAISQASVYGVTSMVFWALTLVITIKYIVLVLRADHMKEGGGICPLCSTTTH